MLTQVGFEGALVSLLLVCGGAVLSGCGRGSAAVAEAAQGRSAKDPLVQTPIPASQLTLVSPAFRPNSAIPRKYTCQGADVSPELQISDPPAGTKSLVLVIDDPDAPDPAAPQRDWIHWVVFDLPPSTTLLPEALSVLPEPARAALNDWGKPTYGGPCPPKGRHRYFFRIYAIDRSIGLNRPTLMDLRSAVAGHVLGAATLMGTYQKT